MLKELIINIVIAILAYLIGSISPAIQIARFKGKDILKEGSGNAGATNAFRVLGLKLGLCVFALDFIKGFLTTFITLSLVGLTSAYIASIAVIVGHIFSVFHKFHAGKGVAPSIGVIFAVNWIVGLICLIFGLVLVLLSRRVSIGSITAAIVLPICTWFLITDFFIYSLLIALLIVVSHRGNIVRIFKGEEKAIF